MCWLSLMQALRSSPALQNTFTSGVWLHPLLPDRQPGVWHPLPPHLPLQRHPSALQRVRDEVGQPCASTQRSREQRVSDSCRDKSVVLRPAVEYECSKSVVCFQVVSFQSVPRSGRTHADACPQGRSFLGAKTQRTQLLRHILQVEALNAVVLTSLTRKC